jgi:hypothetical protein
MSQHRNAKEIQPANVKAMNIPLGVFGWVPKEHFPNGMEIVFFRPGTIEPVGRGIVPPGFVLAVVPPGEAADFLIAQARQASGRPQQGIGLEH